MNRFTQGVVMLMASMAVCWISADISIVQSTDDKQPGASNAAVTIVGKWLSIREIYCFVHNKGLEAPDDFESNVQTSRDVWITFHPDGRIQNSEGKIGRYRINNSREPNTLSLLFEEKGKLLAFRSIYLLKDNTLRIGQSLVDPESVPQSFDYWKEADVKFVILERAGD